MIVEDFYDKACIKFNFTGWRIINNVIYLDKTDGSVTEKQIKDKAQELFQEWQNLQYQRDRLAEYPSIQECIHAILDDDLTALQAKRKLIKEKYPKP